MHETECKNRIIFGILTGMIATICWPVPPVRAGDKIPSGEAIMDSYVKRTGGAQAYGRIRNRVTTGTSDSLKGTMAVKIYEAEPNKRFAELETLRGFVERGSNGDVAWIRTQSKAVAQTDEMRKRALVNSFFHMPYKWRELCTKAECKEIVEIADTKCYKVVLRTIFDFSQTYYIAVDTMLLKGVDQTVRRGSQQRTFGSLMSDYKEVDGILYPHRIERTVDGRHQALLTIRTIEHNVEIPADRFDIPSEVVNLVEEERSSNAPD